MNLIMAIKQFYHPNNSKCIHLETIYNLLRSTLFLNPILTGLFESKFLLGGGGGQDLGPEGADRREILHGCEDTSKEYCYEKKNCRKRFIYYIIIIYANEMLVKNLLFLNLFIFPTIKIYEGQFLVESFLEALLTYWHGQNLQIPNLFLCILLFCKFLMYFIVFISYVFFLQFDLD